MNGSSQSPVDLGPAIESPAVEFRINYLSSVMHGTDIGTTLEFPVAGGSSMDYCGQRFELKQFHFHTPSEHVIDGESAAAEIHFVNEDAHGNKAVVAVFADESADAGGPRRLEQAMGLASLLPGSRGHYGYEGSLTTPPYTEGVQWIVLADRVTLNPDWVAAFSDRYGSNNRSLQPLNGRPIILV